MLAMPTSTNITPVRLDELPILTQFQPHAAAQPASPLTPTASTCTCGQCAGGWLSPSMRYRLNNLVANLPEPTHRFRPFEPLPGWVYSIDPALYYIPTTLQPRLLKPFYNGYRAVLAAIGEALSVPGSTPTASSIRSTMKLTPIITAYFNYGGLIEHALDCIIDLARESSKIRSPPLTRGHDYSWYLTVDPALAHEELVTTPKSATFPCANDMDFDLIRRMFDLTALGYTFGPFDAPPPGSLSLRPSSRLQQRAPSPSDIEKRGEGSGSGQTTPTSALSSSQAHFAALVDSLTVPLSISPREEFVELPDSPKGKGKERPRVTRQDSGREKLLLNLVRSVAADAAAEL